MGKHSLVINGSIDDCMNHQKEFGFCGQIYRFTSIDDTTADYERQEFVVTAKFADGYEERSVPVERWSRTIVPGLYRRTISPSHD